MATNSSKLLDIFNGKISPSNSFSLPGKSANSTPAMFNLNSMMQSNGVSPTPILPPQQTTNPVVSPTAVSNIPKTSVMAPEKTDTAPAPVGAQSQIPSQWIKPDGGIYTPQEVADNIASKMAMSKGQGDVGKLSATQFGPEKTAEEQRADLGNLNNVRNDIAVGATDPYKVASQSGIAYTPAELSAIEKSYAGIYDPAINSAMAKLEAKQEADKSEKEFQNELKKLAKTHDYDMEKLAKDNEYKIALEKMKINADIAKARLTAGDTGSAGNTYVKGQNPVIDGWVERILKSGEDINKIIPGVKNQDLRNKVMLGLNSRRYESAATAGTLNEINTLNTLLANPDLDNISGFMDQYTGGVFGKAKTAKTQFDQIAGTLELAKAGQIKGQGAVSDYERDVLKRAATVASRGQSDEDFKNSLIQIRGAMMTASGLEAPVKIVNPATGESDVQNLTSDEITGFIRDGALVQYVAQ